MATDSEEMKPTPMARAWVGTCSAMKAGKMAASSAHTSRPINCATNSVQGCAVTMCATGNTASATPSPNAITMGLRP
ncbi:Uncharacterised protein [Bordetella pertussis]|nr:Uncharacterised protein [Bordetella pertussis]CFW03636.1 Uncharacterised protein [Bordetella pertussis]